MVQSSALLQAAILVLTAAASDAFHSGPISAVPPGSSTRQAATARRPHTSHARRPTNSFFTGERAHDGSQSSVSLYPRPVTLNTISGRRAPGGGLGTSAKRISKPHHALRLTTIGVDAIDLVDKLREGLPYLGQVEHAELQRALAVALRVHGGTREGRERVAHSVSMCLILGELEMDVDALLAAILAGTLSPERGPVGVAGASSQDLQRRFGRRVVRLVESYEHVARLETLAQSYLRASSAAQGPEEAAEQLDRLRNLILSEVSDWRVVILRVASHLQLMRAAASAPAAANRERAQAAKALAHEALGVHAPLAHRLGIHQLVAELQDLAFARLYPRQNAAIRAQMAARAREYAAVLDRASAELTAALEADDEFMAQVESVSLAGRAKEPYSMWRKMLRTRCALADVHDAVALRVVFKARRRAGDGDAEYAARSTALCHDAMRIVRRLYPTLEGRFKDYVAAPKANGYRSLHATALMPRSDCSGGGADLAGAHPFEVQIRSFEMHQQASFGVASHFSYKGEGSMDWLAKAAPAAPAPAAAAAAAPAASGWGFVVPAEIADGRAFVNWLHNELQSRKVFVFGPDGLIWDLDKSATAADVARRVNIQRFYARAPRGGGGSASSVEIMVHGHQVPRDYALRNGDAISVMA
ncbi:hypothetical protein JKP88DRAFT_197917, partial [Tribonema minus]